MKPKFTFTADSLGYMIYANGKPLGGARSAGSYTRTSDGRRRAWQCVRADLEMHANTARREVAEIEAGRGQPRFRKALEDSK